MKINIHIITLYRYFAYSTHMRDLFRREMDAEGEKWLKLLREDISGLMLLLFSPPGMYLMYSYSGIYLVIEGWKDLKLSDSRIDKLIDSPFVDRLRLFRNATFHYQKDPMSWKHLQFLGTEEEETEKWLNELYSELSRFFSENTLPIPERLKASLKDRTHVEIAQAVKEFWNSENPFDQLDVRDA